MALIFDTVRTENFHTHGSTNNARFTADAWGTKHQTDNGYILFGPANSSHAHIYTDKGSFYLNKGMYVAGGTLLNPNDIRSSIFYDVDNTGYYVNPNGTSNLNALNVGGSLTTGGTISNGSVWINDGSNYNGYDENIRLFNPANGVSVIAFSASGTSGTPLTSVLGYSDRFETRIGSTWRTRLYGGYLEVNGNTRATLFYDSDNTAYYVDPASTSTLNQCNANGFLVNGTYDGLFGFTGMSWGGSTNYPTLYGGHSDRWVMHIKPHVVWTQSGQRGYTGSTQGSLLRFEGNLSSDRTWDIGCLTSIASGGDYFGVVRNYGGATWAFYADPSCNLHANTSMRAPIFYDSNDTNYFLNPASNGSKLKNIIINPQSESWSEGIRFDMPTQGVWGGLRWARNGTTGDAGNWALGYAGNIGNSDDVTWWSGTGNHRWRLNHNGDVTVQGSSRAPIFYDSIDTAYYIDPNSTATSARFRGKTVYGPNTSWGKYLQVGGNGREYVDNGNYASVVTTNGNLHLDAASGYDTYINFYDGGNVIFGGGNTAETARIASDGSARFPVYYDINNTNFYCDPASASKLNTIDDSRGNSYVAFKHSGSDFVDGTLVATDIPSSATNGASFVIEVTGKSYSSNPPFSFMAQGYLYNNGIINYSGVNNGDLRLTYIKVMNYNNYLHFWWPRVSYWNSFEVRVRDAGGGVINRVTSIGNAADPSASASKVTTINLHKSVQYDENTNAGDIYGVNLYASRLYDSGTTSYYLRPAGTSYLHSIWTRGSATNSAPRWDTSFHVVQSQHWYGHTNTQTMYLGESGNITRIRGRVRIGNDADPQSGYDLSVNSHIHMNNSEINYVNQLHFNDNVRFYDDGNDNYLNFKYGAGAAGGIKFLNGSAAQQGFLYADSNGFGLLSANGTWAVRTTDSATVIDHRLDTPIVYDYQNSAYYVDPASTSVLNTLNVTTLNLNGNLDVNGVVTANAYVSVDTSQSRSKFRLWGTSADYAIGMNSSYTYGHLNDYAMSFQMNNDNDRGYWWGDTGHSNAQGAMSLTNDGKLTVATSLNVGYGESVTSPNTTHALAVNGSIETAGIDFPSGGSGLGEIGNYFNALQIRTNAGSTVQIGGAGTGWVQNDLKIGNGDLEVVGAGSATVSFSAPIFYDSNNTGYYVNPQGTSKVAILLVEDQIRTGNGQQLVLNAGESYAYATGQTGENVYVNAENGLQVNSSPDNWGSGWAGRYTTTICDAAGNSYFPGRVQAGEFFTAGKVVHTGDTDTYTEFNAADTWRVVVGGSQKVVVNSNGLTVSNGSVYAPIFYDSDDTGYYLNPASTSILKKVEQTGTAYTSCFDISLPTYASGIEITKTSSIGTSGISFKYNTSFVGSITINNSSTSYNTTSDYRLKENLTPITDGIERVKLLQPKKFNFIGESNIVDGFIAHEAAEVVPESVTGEKDELDHLGNPKYQGIDQAKLVPLLTAALKEAIAKIESLEARVQTLENQ